MVSYSAEKIHPGGIKIMRLLTHIVTPQEDGLPVKHLLQRHFALSSTLLKSVKWREGGITCNGHGVRSLPRR